MNIPRRHAQSGFTLVEIAIVLVIIGLLLGGVLKGTELIENSKVKKAANDINGISAAYYSYLDRYQRSPGDDGPTATLRSRGQSWAAVTGPNTPNGALAASLTQTFNPGTSESAFFWQHLRAAGLVTGDPSLTGTAALPRNAFGGLTGVTSAALNGNLQGIKVCMSQISGKAATALDVQIDDGRIDTGRTRATPGASGANQVPLSAVTSTPYNEDSFYTVCTQI